MNALAYSSAVLVLKTELLVTSTYVDGLLQIRMNNFQTFRLKLGLTNRNLRFKVNRSSNLISVTRRPKDPLSPNGDLGFLPEDTQYNHYLRIELPGLFLIRVCVWVFSGKPLERYPGFFRTVNSNSSKHLLGIQTEKLNLSLRSPAFLLISLTRDLFNQPKAGFGGKRVSYV